VRVAPGLIVGMALGIPLAPALGGAFSTSRAPAPLMLAVVAVAIVCVGVGSALGPARRAARLDPLTVLREN
jgi:ABC-type antimicrobial peptide transport system permease subunit